jgi:L-histidine N-alpha-methyltransferase
MLRAEPVTALPVEIANELRDALGRRQKELPPRWLAAHDASVIRGSHVLPRHEFEDAEREIGLTIVRGALAELRPRAVVCVQPSASRVARALVDAVRERGALTSVAITELDHALASGMLTELSRSTGGQTSIPLVCDCTVELPLPEQFPRPRVYLCLGNAMGRTTTVGAVRMLRVLRTTMSPGDGLIAGLELRSDDADSEVELRDSARHMGAFGLVSSMTGADLDLSRFEYRRSFDSANNRHETHLVARKALTLEVPGVCDVRFRKGESIRTGVSCAFDRNRVVAMMNGVGLRLREWQTDPTARFAVALATPAV